MSCPIPHERLVSYWVGDLPVEDSTAIEEHLFACDACFAAASQVAALATGLRSSLPPVVVERDLARLRAQGVPTAQNDLRPGQPKETWFTPGVDVLVHRLLTDLAGVERVSVELTTMDGTPLISFEDVPFDRDRGAVLVACQRHYMETYPADLHIVVRRIDAGGQVRVESYTPLHRFVPAP